MNVLHVVNGNITIDDGYTQRIKRQQALWKDALPDIKFSVFNTLDWHLLKKPWKIKENISGSAQYCKILSFDYSYCQGYPMSAFFLNPDHYFIHCAKKIQSVCKKNKIDFLYTENLMCSYMGYWCNKLYGLPYIMDYHGAAPEEFQISEKRYGKVDYNYYKEIEKRAINNASGIVCVSNRFKEYLNKEFGVQKEHIIITPSCIQQEKIMYDADLRKSMRETLSIENKKVIIYAGGIGYWHCDKEIIKLFSELCKVDKDLYFIFLTARKNCETVEAAFEINNVDKNHYFINSVGNNEVFKYYAASDYGIIIRFDSLVNEVASPTKVIEYMSNGLAVISTTNIGDIKQIPGVSYLFDYSQIKDGELDLSSLLQFINNGYDREKNYAVCKEFLKTEYTWESMASRYRYLFRNVMK